MLRALVGIPLLLALLASCRTSAPASAQPETDVREVRAVVERLYEAFCFDAGGQADWQTIEASCLPDGVYAAPCAPGSSPRLGDRSVFLADFRAWVASDAARSGLHERILAARIERCGGMAHAFVAFEGVDPASGERKTLGVDSLVLLDDHGRWKVASFATQYADASAGLPRRFLDP